MDYIILADYDRPKLLIHFNIITLRVDSVIFQVLAVPSFNTYLSKCQLVPPPQSLSGITLFHVCRNKGAAPF